MNKFLKFLCSLPICIIVLYFIPFLGGCLILFRYYIYRNKKYYSTPIYLMIIGVLLFIPKLIDIVFATIKLNTNSIPYYDKIINSDIYLKLIPFSKTLLCFGVILLILSFLFRNLYNKLISKLNNTARTYIHETEKRDREISEKNDLLMKEKQLKAKNTHVVKCPNCGSENMLTEQSGTCKFCRQHIEYKG